MHKDGSEGSCCAIRTTGTALQLLLRAESITHDIG